LGTFVAPNGEDKTREAKWRYAEDLIRSAITHATEAGFSKKEIQDLLRTLLEEKKK
jgi:DNA-binding transcriptional regulator YhcF (GntR family)